MLETPGAVGYNMNEVFTDHVRQYFDYTGDMELLRKVFPVLEGIAEWESRRLQPENDAAVRKRLDTWISDSHWYTRGQCTTASSYMLNLHRFLAEAGRALGKDPAPYRRKAEAIRDAMQQKLWQPRRGVFAECLDTLGAKTAAPRAGIGDDLPQCGVRRRRPAAGLPDDALGRPQPAERIRRRAAEKPFGVPTGPRTTAGPTPIRPTTWPPGSNSIWPWPTTWSAGRTRPTRCLRGGLCGMYNGPTPGGLGGQHCVDGRQRRNAEFADAISMFGRAVIEGLFGIRPKRHRGVVELSPQFPAGWSETSIETPHFGYRWKKGDREIRVEWHSPVATAVELRQPVKARRVEQVTVDGKAAAFGIEPGVGLTWLSVHTPVGRAWRHRHLLRSGED